MNKQKGFTLVELVVTAAILAILASIAIPSYFSYIERAQCEDGKALLSNAANFLERYRAQNGGSYANASLAGFGSSSTSFGVEVSDVSATNYTLTATATQSARVSGTMTLTAANVHAGDLAGTCNW